MKQIRWQGSSYHDLCDFPSDAKREAGYQLHKVQQGEEPNDWKPMPGIGTGVREIRIWGESGAYRIIYVVSIGPHIYVLHAFQKKTQKTSPHDIQLAKARLKPLLGKP
ncbi:type II toxin-antitoxin system RelE/ParE family toxin [Methylomagnum sp.]